MCVPEKAGTVALEALARAVRQARARTAVTHTLRFHPAWARAREIVGLGTLGNPEHVDLQRWVAPDAAERNEVREWRLLYQDVDLCAWLLGRPVHAAVLPPGRGQRPGSERTARISHENGSVAHVHWRTRTGDGRGVGRRLSVQGSLGRLDLETADHRLGEMLEPAVIHLSTQPRPRAILTPRGCPLVNELAYLVAALQRREQWVCCAYADAQAALAVMQVIGAGPS